MSDLMVIKPEDYPMIPGRESWFLVHPNNAYCEFVVPMGAAAVCIQPFLGKFKKNKAYPIVNWDKDHGWISISYKTAQADTIYKMPLYLFARYFDAEAFIRRADFNQCIIPTPKEGPYFQDGR